MWLLCISKQQGTYEMSNNRHLISELEIVRPAQILDKGIPLPLLRGKYLVDEGWKVVITEGGAFREILEPGQYTLDRYTRGQDVKATCVNTTVRILTVSTAGEFSIAQPVPVQVNLDLAVEYQVTDPRRVATEVSNPLLSLYDRVLQAVRSAIVYATIDEVRTQGEELGHTTLQRLQATQLGKHIGIEVLNVKVIKLQPMDTGNDVLAALELKHHTARRDWELDVLMSQGAQVTLQWLALNRPQIYAQILAGNQALLHELINKGLLDPAGFMQTGTGSSPIDLSRLLGDFGLSPFGQGQGMRDPGDSAPMLSASTPGDPIARIRKEVEYLRTLPGARVEASLDADGAYTIEIVQPRPSGGEMSMLFGCAKDYPRRVPEVEVYIDREPTPWQSSILRRYNGQYLIEIVREAKQHFG
jgi:regulator of protease activity HflC (stomatin/prohibitin superfamily)